MHFIFGFETGFLLENSLEIMRNCGK